MIKKTVYGFALVLAFGAGYKVGLWQRDSALLAETENALRTAQQSHNKTLAAATVERDAALALVVELKNAGPRIEYKTIKTVIENSSCKRLGADIVYTEFTSSEALIRDIPKAIEKIQFTDEERPIAIQIFGGVEESMEGATKKVESFKPDFIDTPSEPPNRRQWSIA